MQEQLSCGHKSSHNVNRREREKEMHMCYWMRNLEALGNSGDYKKSSKSSYIDICIRFSGENISSCTQLLRQTWN